MNKKGLNLRQQQSLELLKGYDLIIDYQPRKANVVANALSRKSLFALRALNTQLTWNCDGSLFPKLKIRPIFLQLIQELQNNDLKVISN